MYAVYFDWSETEPALWHPLDFPTLNAAEARDLAAALKKAMPHKRFAYGPRFQDGVLEVH